MGHVNFDILISIFSAVTLPTTITALVSIGIDIRNARSEGAKLEQRARAIRASESIQHEAINKLSQYLTPTLQPVDIFAADPWKCRVLSCIYRFKTQLSFEGFFRHLTLYSKKIINLQSIPSIIKTKMKPQVVFVLGGPGAGKGTQCVKIVEEFGFEHLSAGDLLREERSRPNSEFGELIEKHIKEGSIVPVEITCSLLERAMQKSKNYKFLIDGFPRNKNNLDGWTQRVAPNICLLFVLFFDCSAEVSEKRCLDRGAAGSGRVDDNIESLRKRFNTYINDTIPIIEYYQEKGLIQKIDANQTPEQVFEHVKRVFNSFASGDS